MQRVLQNRGNIMKQNAFFRPIWHFAYVLRQRLRIKHLGVYQHDEILKTLFWIFLLYNSAR